MSDNVGRAFCPRCAIKHLGQAVVLLKEAKKGYPHHVWFALAHLAEAEDELVELMPDEADDIRAHRKAVEASLNTDSWLVVDQPITDLMYKIAAVAMLAEVQE